MNKCVKITCHLIPQKDFLSVVIQKYARKFSIEGSAQVIPPDKIRIIACGMKDNIDEFVDLIHKELAKESSTDIEVEPFLKDKDYRGVFRIIE